MDNNIMYNKKRKQPGGLVQFIRWCCKFLIGCKEESDNSKLVTSSGKDYDEWQITKEHLMRIQKAMDDALNRKNK